MSVSLWVTKMATGRLWIPGTIQWWQRKQVAKHKIVLTVASILHILTHFIISEPNWVDTVIAVSLVGKLKPLGTSTTCYSAHRRGVTHPGKTRWSGFTPYSKSLSGLLSKVGALFPSPWSTFWKTLRDTKTSTITYPAKSQNQEWNQANAWMVSQQHLRVILSSYPGNYPKRFTEMRNSFVRGIGKAHIHSSHVILE